MPEEVRSCKEWGRKDSEKHTRRPWLKKDPNSTLCFHAIIADAILLLSPNASCLEQGKCVCAQLLSRVQLFATPWTRACQALLSKGFSRQEYWSELPFPPQGRGFSRPRKPTHVSGIGRRIPYHWTIRKAHGTRGGICKRVYRDDIFQLLLASLSTEF